ncbi:MAG: hypothetical protein CMI12_05425 [Oceanospirillum sp.]|nr:hypothetical protein [Oceanospirillum sp.]
MRSNVSVVPAQNHSYAFARQPILDRDSELVAYELLYRDSVKDEAAAVIHPVLATAQVLMSSMLEQGESILLTGKELYINVPEQALDWVEDWVCPKEQVVIELLEDIPATEDNIAKVDALKKKGYKIALDDFTIDSLAKGFLPYADIVKIDLMAVSREQIEQWWPILKRYSLILLAEKVESHEQWLWCKAQGFDLFQGYFFARPENVSGKTFCSSHLQVLDLINKLSDPAVSISELEGIIKTDPWLYYRLMRYASNLCLKREISISSVRHAIMVIGMVRLKAFLMLISVTRVAAQSDASIAQMFIVAYMAEALAGDIQELNTDTAFLAGTLKAISVALGCSVKVMVAELKLADELKQLLEQGYMESGDFNYMSIAECAEKFSRQGCDSCTGCYMPTLRVQQHYEQALRWSDSLMNTLVEEELPG